jgi:hypothetical protein
MVRISLSPLWIARVGTTVVPRPGIEKRPFGGISQDPNSDANVQLRPEQDVLTPIASFGARGRELPEEGPRLGRRFSCRPPGSKRSSAPKTRAGARTGARLPPDKRGTRRFQRGVQHEAFSLPAAPGRFSGPSERERTLAEARRPARPRSASPVTLRLLPHRERSTIAH